MLILHGTKTSAVLNSVLADLFHLKRDHAVKYTKKNDNIRPFESGGETSLEFFSLKSDCSLLVYGSHSKKRPNNLVFGRTYDHHIYDLVEVGVENYKSIESYAYHKKFAPKLGTKPFFAFIGEHFESVEGLNHLKEMLLDHFKGEVVENLNLAGVDRIFVCTAISPTTVYMMHCALRLKRSGTSIPGTAHLVSFSRLCCCALAFGYFLCSFTLVVCRAKMLHFLSFRHSHGLPDAGVGKRPVLLKKRKYCRRWTPRSDSPVTQYRREEVVRLAGSALASLGELFTPLALEDSLQAWRIVHIGPDALTPAFNRIRLIKPS